MREHPSLSAGDRCAISTFATRLLVPTDFSATSQAALTYALAIVDQCDATLHLLHVIEDIAGPEPLPRQVARRSEVVRAVEASVWEDLERQLSGQDRQRIAVTLAVAWGQPMDEILRYARAQDIDLIAMGSDGRGALGHLLTGHVAERVVRGAPCAVLTVRRSPGRPFRRRDHPEAVLGDLFEHRTRRDDSV